MAVLLEYKCPSCGGALSFDSSLQMMKCPYCDTEFEVSALQELDEEIASGKYADESAGR
jgi:tRNA(Ile2) C34 agmatinyltransferase TiaS